MYKYISENYKDLVVNIKKYFDDSSQVLFKQRNILKLVEYKGAKYAIKSFKKPNFINKIVYKYFRKSKARRSYENSVKLESLGINTARPIGYFEEDGFLFTHSYYISEYFDYDFEIRAVFKDKKFSNRVEILKEFIKFTYHLHNQGVYHIDYSPGNILVKKLDDKYQFFIIDVNRMKFIDFDIDLRMKSMCKLTSNTDDNNLLVKYYAIELKIDSKILSEKYNFYLEEQKKYLENKRKFKKLKGK